VFATASWKALRYDRNPELDGSETRLGLKYRYVLNPASEVVFGAAYTHVAAAVPFNGYDGIKPSLEIYRELRNGVIADVRLAYEHRRYGADFPLLGYPRIDNGFEFAAGLAFRRFAVHGFAPRIEYLYRRTSSNIELFDTDSHAVSLTFTKRY
jgi:hypothetical protein